MEHCCEDCLPRISGDVFCSMPRGHSGPHGVPGLIWFASHSTWIRLAIDREEASIVEGARSEARRRVLLGRR